MASIDFESLWQSFGVPLSVVGGFWLLICASGAIPALLLWYADFDYVEDPRPTIARAAKAMGKQWLIDAGFKPEGVIAPMGIRMALFRHKSGHTGLAVYFVTGRMITDMFTRFPNRVGVSTSNTVDGVTAPLPPGGLIQCLPASNLAKRWQQHIDSAKLLRDELQIRAEPLDDLADSMYRSTDRQARYMFTHPWVILALPYRFLITRLRYRNVTVRQQLEKGWIDTRALSEQAQGAIPS